MVVVRSVEIGNQIADEGEVNNRIDLVKKVIGQNSLGYLSIKIMREAHARCSLRSQRELALCRLDTFRDVSSFGRVAGAKIEPGDRVSLVARFQARRPSHLDARSGDQYRRGISAIASDQAKAMNRA